jgi:DNA invertase Pin-like site-specific DNA recombinase
MRLSGYARHLSVSLQHQKGETTVTRKHHIPSSVTLPTSDKAAVYIRQAAANQTTMGKDLRELNTQLLLTFARSAGWCDENLVVFNDSGIPASAPLEKREGLQELIKAIEHGEVKAVLISSEYSLYRDAALADILFFVHLCQYHHVFVITPDMVYDFNNAMHAKLFQFRLDGESFVLYARTKLGKRRKQAQTTKESRR